MNPMQRGLAGQVGGTPGAGTPGGSASSSITGRGSSSSGGFSPLPDQKGWVEGLQSTDGVVRPGYIAPPPQPRPECAISQCGCHTELAYFQIIEAAAPTIIAGQAAWYGLRSINVRQQLAQEIRVLGLHWHLLPTNPNAQTFNGAASPIAWGDTLGLNAAIVVGVNLPIQLNAWTSAPAYIPGIDAAAATPAALTRVTGNNTPRYIGAPIRFPTGSIDQVTPNVSTGHISLEADMYPVRIGERLDVALVVAGSQINGQTGQVAGLAQVGVVCGHTINDRPWQI